MKILIVEDFAKWQWLIALRLRGKEAEITIVRTVPELKKILSSGQHFFAVALDGWLGEEVTLRFIPSLLEISKIVISTSQDMKLRKEMVQAGCHTGGNKWDFVDLLTELKT